MPAESATRTHVNLDTGERFEVPDGEAVGEVMLCEYVNVFGQQGNNIKAIDGATIRRKDKGFVFRNKDGKVVVFPPSFVRYYYPVE